MFTSEYDLTSPDIDTAPVVKELQRELAMRRRVYPDWVKAGKLSQQQADHRIEMLETAIYLLDEAYPQPVQGELL